MMQRFLLFAALLLLGACQSFSSRDSIDGSGSPALWRQHSQQVSRLDAWDINGKLAIRSQAQSGSGVLFWLQRQDYFDIRVTGPLGQGATRLTGRPGQVQLTTPQLELNAASAEALMQNQLGWSLPVNNLLWWVRGLPAPDSKYHLQLNNDSLAQQLEQDGWQLEFVRYQTLPDGTPLPERIQLQGPHLQLTLLVKQWQARTLGGQP
ncbi:lipoprotein insertase outer membrane protein LolB [Thiopseudomonas denitrificans]|uniref:Outer-membrane lipoprotein LolB n=1 Tax=Thiopseudomonas denitrificans TaxID=1501432 RepID=A0A4R6U7F2_9GAMM|nr:lipoprotein insertase outer membrane protein LolB [Thiopseudomonas denitrificans]TDQ38974.1 outer membrane lipoprotein LolB [Thiopseudomonas denitrificans]